MTMMEIDVEDSQKMEETLEHEEPSGKYKEKDEQEKEQEQEHDKG